MNFGLKRSAVRRKRPGRPRRGRIIDKAFIAWMHLEPCAVAGFASGCRGPITFHHVRRFGEQKDDRRGLALCEAHHLHDAGPDSIERLGKKRFEQVFGINIEYQIVVSNERYEKERAA